MPPPSENTGSLLGRASVELRSGRPAAAAALYREILALDPDHAEATHFLGLALVQSGGGDEALALLRRSIALHPAEAGYRRNLALALAESGRLAEAEASLGEAIAAAPGISWFHNFLGVVLQRRGALHAALRAYGRALELDPQDDTVHNNLGHTLLESGDADAAAEHLRGALRLNPRNAMAHNNLGNALRAKGDLERAEASYRSAIEIEPRFAHAHYNLGVVLREQGNIEAAIGSFRASARLAPEEPGRWQALADAFAGVRFRTPDPGMEADLAACLERGDVEPMNVALAAFSLLRTNSGFESLLRGSDSGDAQWLTAQALQALRAPLFRLLLENVVVPDPVFEGFLQKLRRAVRAHCASGAAGAAPEALELACALAQQCFLGDYVLGEAPDESAWLEGIERQFREEQGGSLGVRERLLLALYAAYRPLRSLGAARRAEAAAAGGAFARLILRQVTEPAEEQRLRGEIAALTAVEEPASRAVQAQYEQSPYPRWHRAPSFVGAYPLGLKLRTLFPHLPAEDIAVPDGPGILIAGCGTGRHAAITAALHPAARILAVDLSEASLAFALRRCRELGIANVRFAKADLLRLGVLGERFDLIECAGVLHHLEDPIAGWRVLVGLLQPRGFMKIALYSEIAHSGVLAAKRLIAKGGFEATPAGMRAARAAIVALPEGAPERSVLGLTDFYSLSECRDLLFHARDRRFDAEGIEAALRALDLEFLGFQLDSPAVQQAYRRQYPDDASCASLGNWAAFEALNPDTFSAMYQFWVRKRNRA